MIGGSPGICRPGTASNENADCRIRYVWNGFCEMGTSDVLASIEIDCLSLDYLVSMKGGAATYGPMFKACQSQQYKRLAVPIAM